MNVEEEYHEESSAKDESSRLGARGTGRDAPVIPRHHYDEDHPVHKPTSPGLSGPAVSGIGVGGGAGGAGRARPTR